MQTQNNSPPEIWKTVPDFPGYEASTAGRIRRKSTGRLLKPFTAKNNQPYVFLRSYHTEQMFTVGAVIYKTHINPSARYVYHIDRNPHNNQITNLYTR